MKYVFVDPEKSMEENFEHSVKMEEKFKKWEAEKDRED